MAFMSDTTTSVSETVAIMSDITTSVAENGFHVRDYSVSVRDCGSHVRHYNFGVRHCGFQVRHCSFGVRHWGFPVRHYSICVAAFVSNTVAFMSDTTASVLPLLCQTLWLSCQTLQLKCQTLVLISDTTSVRISGKTLQHPCQDTAFHFGHHYFCICWTQHLPCKTLVLKTVASVSAAVTSVLDVDYYMKHCSLCQILWPLCESVCSVSVWFPCQIHYYFNYFMWDVDFFILFIYLCWCKLFFFIFFF